ncbi:MAG: class I mannose-6-phosphate isomerase [Lachnospiraceae bacterium]|nr:class I mannose-6-phosphate isomerase [Lachnospiraceae bacterium]
MSGTKEILFLEPKFVERVWGGNRLATEFQYHLQSDRIGECWAVSAHENGESVVKRGLYQGKTLSSLWQEHRELFGNIDLDKFPLLVKLIDARETSSIQVHPDNAYVKAQGLEGLGKTECWYVVDCPENATLVIGHNAHTKEELSQMVNAGQWNDLLKEVPVKQGDFIQIEAGVLHTIEAGFIVYETQQNSDITYRFYDYGRKIDGQKRELHIKECLDVTLVPDKTSEKRIISTQDMVANEMHELICCDSYQVWKMDVTRPVTIEQKYPFLVMSVLDGEGLIDGAKLCKGDHLILPFGYGKAQIQGTLKLMMSSVPVQETAGGSGSVR